jgi:hypothetical protein
VVGVALMGLGCVGSDPDDAGARTRRGIVKSSNFTGQTNTVDVDKHMYVPCPLPSPRSVYMC